MPYKQITQHSQGFPTPQEIYKEVFNSAEEQYKAKRIVPTASLGVPCSTEA